MRTCFSFYSKQSSMTRHFFVFSQKYLLHFVHQIFAVRKLKMSFYISFLSDSLIISFRDIFQLSFLSEKKILSLSLKNQVLHHSLRSFLSTFSISSFLSEITSFVTLIQ